VRAVRLKRSILAEKHWHGTTATTAMTHIAIQKQLKGKAVDWMEKVSNEPYKARL
jgi:quercetin dioxygenase-like cupin family protein